MSFTIDTTDPAAKSSRLPSNAAANDRYGMLIQFTSTALIVVVSALALSGSATLVWHQYDWVMSLHRAAAWCLLGLLPWKTIIVIRSVRKGLHLTVDRGLVPLLSALLAGLVLLTASLGLAWMWNFNGWWVVLGQTIASWHWVAGLAMIPFFIFHAIVKWPRPRRRLLLSRGALRRAAIIAAAGLVGWPLAEWLAQHRRTPEHGRRPSTGSRQFRSYQGNAMPVTTNPGEAPRRLDPARWRLAVEGQVGRPLAFSYQHLLDLPSEEWTATVDCTVGWYSIQNWRGVPLVDLVRHVQPGPGARFIRLVADTGYLKTFTMKEVEGILLATHVGGEPLAFEHGFPLRAVVPWRRGWFWVKWLTRIEVLRSAGAAGS